MLEFDGGFAGENGEPLATKDPTHAAVTVEAVDAGARMTTVTKFANTSNWSTCSPGG